MSRFIVSRFNELCQVVKATVCRNTDWLMAMAYIIYGFRIIFELHLRSFIT